jgi:ribosome-binding factor A
VADHIQRELTDIIRGQMRDPRIGMLSINEIRVTRDLAYADVYVSMLEARTDEERRELVDVLGHASGYLRTLLSARSTMRTTPRLRFHYDETVERGASLDRLIHDAVAEDLARNPEASASEPGAGRPEGEE